MEQVFIESFILGLFVGIVLSILILDDYCETKMNEFYQEREAQYYISEATCLGCNRLELYKFTGDDNCPEFTGKEPKQIGINEQGEIKWA